MVHWSTICAPKEVGGLGIMNIKHMNWCLMAKWAWKMLTGQGGLWLDIIKHKYLQHAPVSTASCQNGSQFWKATVKIRHLLRVGAVHTIGNGKSTVFWLDVWLGPGPLANVFPRIFAITTYPNSLVSENWRNGQWCPQFRRSLGPVEVEEWDHLVVLPRPVSPSTEPDSFRWKLEPLRTVHYLLVIPSAA